MNIIAAIASLISILKMAPQLIQVVREIIALIKSLKNDVRVDEKQFAPKLRDAIKEIRENRSTAKLEALHKELTDLCGPDGCGMRDAKP